jgi:hypothetical protein
MNRTASPRRTAATALGLALAVSFALTGAVAAKDHPNKGKHQDGRTVTVQTQKAASLTTKGNASHAGGVFRVVANVHAANDLRPDTANAIVHFASGDVSVVLTRSGGGASYHANVPVPAAEAPGVVMIDATAVVDGATLTATGSGKIVAPGDEDATETDETPDADESTDDCTTVVTDPATETDEATDADVDADEASQTDEATEADEDADAPAANDCDEDGLPHLTAEMIAKIIAFLETLFA